MPVSWKGSASRFAPRALALLWAIFGASRVVAYINTSPPQLAAVAAVLPLWPLGCWPWVVWCPHEPVTARSRRPG